MSFKLCRYLSGLRCVFCGCKRRCCGDVKMRGSPEKLDTGPASVIAEADRKMLDKLALPDLCPRFRSRFLSMSKTRRRRRRSRSNKLSLEGRLLVDEYYHSPARLLLSQLGDWNFNIFSLDVLAGGRSLFHVAYHLFQTYDLVRGFQLDPVRLLQFFTLVEDNYHESNPYHNAVHAADVTQSMHCFLQEREVYDSTSQLEKMAALIASLTHDLDHPGVNNTFLIATSNHLAALYQNLSVLENHHWRSAVGLLQETGLLSHLSSERRVSFIKLLKSLILATDITRQQEFLLRFSRYIESGEFQYRRNEEHRHFMLQIALKCADISNPCRPWKISQRWSRRVCNEFFLQGDTERALNVAVTPLCDRYGNTVANIQHGFMQFVVSPLFKAWDRFMGSELSGLMLQYLAKNQSHWKSIMDKGREISELTSDEEDMEMEEEVKEIVTVEDRREEMRRRSVPEEDEEEMQEEEEDEEEEDIGEEESISQPLLVNEESMDKLDSVVSALHVSKVREGSKFEQRQIHNTNEEEEEEGKSEEDDVVQNDVNLMYHYQTDSEQSEQSGRCLSPVNEDMDESLLTSSRAGGGIRRFSVPHLVRRDLNFYLGLRKDGGNGSKSQFLRRQSLPVTAMYFHGSSNYAGKDGVTDGHKSRSLSMDALLATRPKISNLSPSMEASFLTGGLDPLSFTPLQNQTLLLQGGSLTRFTSNPTSRRASADPAITTSDPERSLQGYSSELHIPPYQQLNHPPTSKPPTSQANTGLASSWPSIAKRRTTNGSTHHFNNPMSNTQHVNSNSIPKPYLPYNPQNQLDNILQTSNPTSPSSHENFENNNNNNHVAITGNSSSISHQQHNNNNGTINPPQCLSITADSSTQEDHGLTRPQ